MSKRKARRREVVAIIEELARRFPQVFVANIWNAHKPLAVGVGPAVIAACPDLPPKPLRLALGAYIARLAYREAVAAGGPRFNLAGQVEGEVTLEHIADARMRVETMERKRRVRLANASAAHKAKLEAAKLAKASKQAPPAPAAPPRLSIADLRAAALARRASKTAMMGAA
jgi:sRNA-binding protein